MGLGAILLPWGHERVWLFRGAFRLVPHRWPIVFVAPAFYVGGYPWGEAIALTAVAAVLAAVAFVTLKVLDGG